MTAKKTTHKLPGVCGACSHKQIGTFPIGTLASGGGICAKCGQRRVVYAPTWTLPDWKKEGGK